MMFSTCKRIIISETFEPVWVRSPDASYCIHSLSTPQRITKQCQEPGSLPKPMSSSQILIEGTGVQPNSSSCYAHAEAFKLIPHSSGQTTVTLTKAYIILPNVENLLKSSEEVMLQPQVVSVESLERLEAIAKRTASRNQLRGTDVPRMMEVLRRNEPSRQPELRPWFAGVIIVFIIVDSLWPIWFISLTCFYKSLRDCVKPNTPKQLLDSSINKKGNEHQTKLQVTTIGHVSEPREGDARTNADPELESSPALTEFLRHGMLISD